MRLATNYSLRSTLERSLTWHIICAFIYFICVMILIRQADLLYYLYPALALLLGIFLYCRNRPMYLGYTLWIWFLTPLIRRLVDYQIGWHSISFVMLTPYLVTLIAVFTLLKHLPAMVSKRYLYPYLLLFFRCFIWMGNWRY